jgi:hypothetical protein
VHQWYHGGRLTSADLSRGLSWLCFRQMASYAFLTLTLVEQSKSRNEHVSGPRLHVDGTTFIVNYQYHSAGLTIQSVQMEDSIYSYRFESGRHPDFFQSKN